ncbi:MAG: hypothetical protein ACKODX_03010 [Gemmata sp.]|jgi:hypothetical protein
MPSSGFRVFVMCSLFALGCLCVLDSAQHPVPADPAPAASPDEGRYVPAWVRALERA